jgi:hypothetical protein
VEVGVNIFNKFEYPMAELSKAKSIDVICNSSPTKDFQTLIIGYHIMD